MVWVFCGAGRGVGKTVLAKSVADVLGQSVYCKCGHAESKPGKAENYFDSYDILMRYVDQACKDYENVCVESNRFVYSGCGDVVVFIDGAEGVTDFRDDSDVLREKADIVVSEESTVEQWGSTLSGFIADRCVIEKVCECLSKQKKFLLSKLK